ncbi:hypothetical protein FB45DRAFT_902803 [Roridomyces roridus]|uniref:Uncharacterized protein n=1 Tax=Roridomyces roridus TaxID=1738132 RepID=A0AAD7C3Q4_9AGAR|nr:hypothetical protein FB45DRAFT_902803 [Roridomyces roridus]
MVGPANDKRLLWHPRQDNKFVVGGGQQITLYEWAPEAQEIRHITSQNDLQFMKTFAWSPDPGFEDLVAVGLSTGRVDLLRLEATRHTRRTTAGNSVLSSGPVVSLTARNSRAVHALDFCRVDPNFIAVGLDKVRGDSSLVIYDVSTARAQLALSLVPLSPRPLPPIPRSDIARGDERMVQHHAPTEIVSSVAYVSNSNHLVLAGMSYRWFRLLDIRTPVPAMTHVAAKVQSIVSDPFDPHRIATFGDGHISVWDARKLAPAPLLSFSERDAAADGAVPRVSAVYSGIEFSGTRRGTLAALHRDSAYVRFWDMLGSYGRAIGGSGSSDGDVAESASLSSRFTRKSWAAGLPWTGGPSPGLTSSLGGRDTETRSLVLCDTRRTKLFPKNLSSFALVPSSDAHLPLASNVMVVNREGDLELYALHDTPKQAVWNSHGDLAISAGQSCRIFPGIVEDEEMEDFLRERGSSLEQLRYVQATKTERSKSVRPERGRTSLPPFPTSPVLFGRGDEDGFPALGTDSPRESSVVRAVQPTGISASRPPSTSKSRTWSPSSLRRYPYGTPAQSRSRSRTGQKLEQIPQIEQLPQPAPIPVSENDTKHRGRTSKKSRGGRDRSSSKIRGFEHVVQEDISMVMRTRCLRGYSIGNPYHNTAVTRDDDGPVPQMLSDLWSWMNSAQDFLCVPTPRLHGYDFSHQGVLAIWEGFQSMPTDTHAEPSILFDPSTLPPVHRDLLDVRHGTRSPSRSRRSHSPADDLHGNFLAALTALAMRTGEKVAWRFHAVSTSKPLQRQVALQLCGWSLRDEELFNSVKRWEKEGNHSQAACWLVFRQHYTQALEVLMRSDDESHHMMSGTLAVLLPGDSTRSPQFYEHCERLIVRLQDPYFRAMLTHLTSGDWGEVLEEEILPFRERLAIALQFLEDDDLTTYLHQCVQDSIQRGDIDGLLVTGLTKRGMDILQGHVDRTGDIQTAAILSSYACPSKFVEPRAERWVEAYRDLLDGFKLHHLRVGFDIDRGSLVQDAAVPNVAKAWSPQQILIRCSYCNKSVTKDEDTAPKHKPTTCANCSRALPRCSICLMTLSIVPDTIRDAEFAYSPGRDTIDDAIIICQSCRHGGHASHIFEWFYGDDGGHSHGVCAVANCECRCIDEF